MLRAVAHMKQQEGQDLESNRAQLGAGSEPVTVHLIWAVRNLQELQLLDPELVAAGRLAPDTVLLASGPKLAKCFMGSFALILSYAC